MNCHIAQMWVFVASGADGSLQRTDNTLWRGPLKELEQPVSDELKSGLNEGPL